MSEAEGSKRRGTTDGFSDTLNVVTEDLAVTFGTALAQTLWWQSSQQ